MSKISLSVPNLKGNEWKYVKECIDTEWVSSAGKYVGLFEEKISEYTGSKFSIACVNGTSALQVSLRLSGVKSGDEVIVPTLTFIAPINAVSYNGAKPIFMDADEYYNIDVEKTITFIKNETVFKDGFTYNRITNKKISALIPVHVWGNAARLDDLVPLCEERNINVVEDSSESLGTFYSDCKYLSNHTGTIGKLGCLSFNGNKIITAGGGGMILTNEEKLAEKARYLTTQAKDEPLHYIHHEIGYNYRLTNIQAALGLAQLEQLPKFLKRKKDIYMQYVKALEDFEGLSIAGVPDYANNNHWMNILQIVIPSVGTGSEKIIARLAKCSIQSRPIWSLNHKQRPYKKCQNYKIERANDLVQNSLCLPSSSNIDNKQIKKIIKNLL